MLLRPDRSDRDSIYWPPVLCSSLGSQRTGRSELENRISWTGFTIFSPDPPFFRQKLFGWSDGLTSWTSESVTRPVQCPIKLWKHWFKYLVSPLLVKLYVYFGTNVYNLIVYDVHTFDFSKILINKCPQKFSLCKTYRFNN